MGYTAFVRQSGSAGGTTPETYEITWQWDNVRMVRHLFLRALGIRCDD